MADEPVKETVNLFGKEVSKVEKYGWKTVDRPGTHMMLPKQALNVDHRYQRNNVSQTRIANIRANWSWQALGVLLVMRRRDGTFWVFDGQHRKLAADAREDIQLLPCLVFDCDGTEDVEAAREALAFLLANTNRGAMDRYSKLRAALQARDEIAVAMNEMVESSGYSFARGGAAEQTVACIDAIEREFKRDREAARKAWLLCVAICDGKPVTNLLYLGIAHLERHLVRRQAGTVMADPLRQKLLDAGLVKIDNAMRDEAARARHGGSAVWADGIIDILNKHARRHNRIPCIGKYSSTED